MLLSEYNKFIFSVFTENRNYLIITIYAFKFGRQYVSYLHIQYTRTDSSGRYLPAFTTRDRLRVIDFSDWDIVFSDGKVIFREDSVKIEFSSGMVMAYLNFTWNNKVAGPIEILGKPMRDEESISWNTFDFKSYVKGNFITPLTSTEFYNASGNIDLIKTKKIPLKVPVAGMLWSRLHHKEIDLFYSFVFNRARRSDSKLIFYLDNKLIEFKDVEYRVKNEKIHKRLSLKYPDNFVINAFNRDYQVEVTAYDHIESDYIESFNNIDFKGKLFAEMFLYRLGYPKELCFMSKTDIKIRKGNTGFTLDSISSVSEYVGFSR